MIKAGNEEIISKASQHTIKKFELIEKYVESWAQKLLNNQHCEGLVFIDCMCCSGEYTDEHGQQVFGTPVRVSKILREAAGQYPNKQIYLYFNDISNEKVDHLKKLVPSDKSNFHVLCSIGDGNALLKKMGPALHGNYGVHYLLMYDPYQATIDWNAIFPFLNNWGEVIINHMTMDSTRAVKVAKSKTAVDKYEQTYLTDIERLLPFGSNRTAYEKRIEEIIVTLRLNKTRKYYIAAFPFFNCRNSIVYNLIHCTGNIAGFKLFKQSAWKTFDGKSSTKNTHGSENQLMLDLDGTGFTTTITDADCYYIKDIAQYLQKIFNGQQNVELNEVWAVLDEHPIFPSDGFKPAIKSELKQNFGAVISRDHISFSTRG
jgi:three-Cys-motif partner protein